ncbi:LysE family transporter [Demequina sp.]|uniref:LysE/ArgO family amino acid transporter n=1 Tax=Demequina sp. TaxID=2050685 RepID=UPI0025FE22AF|nr:LysE family transporter [Demequina sp.]
MNFLAGLGLGLSLIVAIGAQNVFVLRQGLRREHVGIVVLVCAVSDAVLIAAGVAGVGAAIESVPWLVTGARWAGAAFLLVYGILAARRALSAAGEHLDTADAQAPAASSRRAVLLTALALTWLNPHVYLDTVVLLGTVASTHGDARWLFAAGAMTGSVVWFSALGYGARLLSGVLARPRAWRILDGAIAVVMVAIAVSLVVGS